MLDIMSRSFTLIHEAEIIQRGTNKAENISTCTKKLPRQSQATNVSAQDTYISLGNECAARAMDHDKRT